MRKLVVLVGLQGAGKTTVQSRILNWQILRPSTSRDPRPGENPADYHFEAAWDPNLFAWQIQFNTANYGMRKTELDSVNDLAITVFEPSNLHILEQVIPSLGFEVITVGLDTIPDLATQNVRVQNNPRRSIVDQPTFDAQHQIVLNCDVVLSGGVDVVVKGLDAICRVLSGRGGVLDSSVLTPLLAAGTLLQNSNSAQIEPASYDLTIGDVYWCQGVYKEVAGNDVIQIPAYSFIFATAQEQACMPRFVSGNFDLSVSMFFNGVILSNGPQVDPGYRGALFCMLYNTTDQPVPITRGAKFATLQFLTTTHVTSGYSGAYQRKSTFKDFVSGRMAISQGGRILERLNEVHSNNSTFKNFVLAWLALTSAIAIGCGTWAFYAADKAISGAEKAAAAIEKVGPAVDSLEKQKEGMDARFRKLEELGQKMRSSRHQ